MATAAIKGAMINYQWDGGEGKPVLLLSNSLSTDLRMWEGQIPAFTEHFRVLRYDNRGHGGSSSPGGEYTMDEIAGDAVALMDEVGVERAHVCGVSMGGMVAMWLGINVPHRVDKLVMSNTSSDVSPPDPWQARIEAIQAGGMEAIVEAGVERFLSEEYRVGGGEAIDLMRSMLRGCDADGYCGCVAAVRDMSLTSGLSGIDKDVLVIAGELDPATPVSHSEVMMDHLPNAEMAVIPGVAHLSNAEKPDVFNDLVLKHLLG